MCLKGYIFRGVGGRSPSSLNRQLKDKGREKKKHLTDMAIGKLDGGLFWAVLGENRSLVNVVAFAAEVNFVKRRFYLRFHDKNCFSSPCFLRFRIVVIESTTKNLLLQAERAVHGLLGARLLWHVIGLLQTQI